MQQSRQGGGLYHGGDQKDKYQGYCGVGVGSSVRPSEVPSVSFRLARRLVRAMQDRDLPLVKCRCREREEKEALNRFGPSSRLRIVRKSRGSWSG